MSPKLLIVLTVLAVVLGAFAVSVKGTSTRVDGTAELGPLFADLSERLNEAALVEVQTPEGSYSLRLEGDRWVLVDKGGYPVKVEDIRRTLWALTTLQRIQPMTEDPARYERLGVQDLEAPGAEGKRIVLRDVAGREVAALIVGNSRGSGRGVASFYARIPHERRSWLVEGELPLPADASSWLDRQPVKVERRAVQAVETRHPDGELVRISRPGPEQDAFDVHDVPEGREIRFATVASGMGTALEYLTFQDVAPAADFEASADLPVVTSLWTFDGRRIDARVWSKGEDEHWVAFNAAYEPQGRPESADEGVGPGPPDPTEAEAVRKGVQELEGRLAGWVYRIAPYNRGNLAKRMEDLTQPLAPPASIAAPAWDHELGYFGETEEPAPGEGPDTDPAEDEAVGSEDADGEHARDSEDGDGR
jgi:hypothetical protein